MLKSYYCSNRPMYDISLCKNMRRNKDQERSDIVQTLMSVLVAFGFISIIILIFYKTCRRRSDLSSSEYNAGYIIYPRVCNQTLQSNSVYEPSLDRPPSYNEICAQFPYESPFNKVSVHESPQVRPETAHSSYQANQTFPSTNHI